jgi:hypothetical protein
LQQDVDHLHRKVLELTFPAKLALFGNAIVDIVPLPGTLTKRQVKMLGKSATKCKIPSSLSGFALEQLSQRLKVPARYDHCVKFGDLGNSTPQSIPWIT